MTPETVFLESEALVAANVQAPASVVETLHRQLNALREVQGFLSAVIARPDGLTIHHTLRKPHEAALLCAIAAAMVGSSRQAARELSRGGFVHGMLHFEEGTLLVAEAGSEAILACMVAPETNVGHALLVIKRLVPRIEEVLAQL